MKGVGAPASSIMRIGGYGSWLAAFAEASAGLAPQPRRSLGV